MDFKSEAKQEGGVLRLKFSGAIDEDAQFPSVSLGAENQIEIDLDGIKSINSVGIRGWLDWIRPISEKAKISLIHSPKAMVFQFNMVNGFLPPGTKVESFYVPFFCEKCDREDNVLFRLGQEVTVESGNLKINYDAKSKSACQDPDCELEMDVTEAKYFQFLKR